MITDDQLLAWWRLAQLPRVGNISLNGVRDRLADSRDLQNCSSNDLIAFGLDANKAQQWSSDSSLDAGFEKLQAWRQKENCGVLLAGVDPYPKSLSVLPDAPIILYYQGNLECLEQAKVAMVGSRNATPYALEWTHKTARDLAASNVCVVSGLALGIDGAAHIGALESGSTIAVLGSGLDTIYPQRHLGLAQLISNNGLLLSEFELGTSPQPKNFPSRNRIVSGLSLAVVVAEAATKSGSLITAKLAADQGREVFALPGVVSNPLSAGCHQLIRDGATLVTGAQDILEDLNLTGGAQFDLLSALEPTEQTATPKLLKHIDYTATAVDLIALRSGVAMAQLLSTLLELELEGWLQQVPGGYRRLR